MAKTIINKHGYEVVSPTRCKSAVTGEMLKKGDLVELMYDTNGSTKAKKGERFKIALMWKNKYATVLELEGTELSAASTFFRKVK